MHSQKEDGLSPSMSTRRSIKEPVNLISPVTNNPLLPMEVWMIPVHSALPTRRVMVRNFPPILRTQNLWDRNRNCNSTTIQVFQKVLPISRLLDSILRPISTRSSLIVFQINSKQKRRHKTAEFPIAGVT